VAPHLSIQVAVNARRSIAALLCALSAPVAGAALAHAQAPVPAPAVPMPEESPPDEFALDAAAPRLVLGGRRVQPLAPRFEAHGTCDERCEFEATARVYGVEGLRHLRVFTPSKASDGGTRMRFHVAVTPRAHKLIDKALRARRSVRVAVDVAAYDLASNATEGRRWIRVRPPDGSPPPVRRS
jgi:hypothetical protein